MCGGEDEWQRLGLPEKNFFNDNFELVLSEHSDANTNSTTLLSDETDDRPKETATQEADTSNQREYEPKRKDKMEDVPSSVADGHEAMSPRRLCSRPIKTNLRVAESSAFVAYVGPKHLLNSGKKKERTLFDKKVRYANRKKLAETRPRVRGQFVRQASNTEIISSGDDISEDEDDPSSREVEMVSSPE